VNVEIFACLQRGHDPRRLLQRDPREFCMTQDAILKAIMETREEEIERRRSGVPTGVRLSTLTSTIRDKAVWSAEDQFPSDQVWADEVERILSFTQVQGQLNTI
jgi:hypothetical protein